ncbi:MAG: class I SAM-dependent methyltransferase [Clostridia bacterium]
MNSFDKRAFEWDNDPAKIERAQIISDKMTKHIQLSKDMVGFEYGCGTGLLSFNLQPYLDNIVLGDSSEGMLEIVKQKMIQKDIHNMTPIKIDLTKDLPPKNKFDLIYTLLTLHHILDTTGILRTFNKMLNEKGYLCIADLDEEDGTFHKEGFIGHNGYNRVDLEDTLKANGFSVLDSEVCYHIIKKGRDGKIKSFPMFLIITQKR